MSNQITQSPKRKEKSKRDVVDRFLTILWKKEIGFKLTTK